MCEEPFTEAAGKPPVWAEPALPSADPAPGDVEPASLPLLVEATEPVPVSATAPYGTCKVHNRDSMQNVMDH
jgi:hypothetical protein